MLTGGRLLWKDLFMAILAQPQDRVFRDCIIRSTLVTFLVVDSYIKSITCVLPESVELFLMLIQP